MPDPLVALVLCGGLGTRIRGVSAGLPKIMLPVHGRPFLALLVDQLSHWGADQIVLCTGVNSDPIKTWVEGHAGMSPPLSVLDEDEPTGTLRPIAEAFAKLRLRTALVCNGDTFIEGDLGGLLAQRLGGDDLAALGLCHVDDANGSGLAETIGGRLVGFVRGLEGPGLVSNGLVRLHADALTIAEPMMRDVNDLLVALASAGKAIAVAGSGSFIDIGTPAGYDRIRAVL